MIWCPDFETTIDREQVLDYVLSNKDWFLEQINLQISTPESIKGLLDKYNKIRILRDNGIDNDAVQLYNELEQLYKEI